MNKKNRPLSPHLQIYRLPFAAVLSITHRVTGVILAGVSILLVYWLSSLATGPQAFADAQACFNSELGQIVLFLSTFALYFHLCNGIRHLFWDAGLGFELKTVDMSGQWVVVAAIGLTLFTWLSGFNF